MFLSFALKKYFDTFFPNSDFVPHPTKNKGGFHPGVLSSIYEEFEKVNMLNGFWWIICKNSKFTTNILKPKMTDKNNATLLNLPNT